MKTRNITKVISLAIFVVLLMTTNVTAQVDLDNNGILGDETSTISTTIAPLKEIGVVGSTETVFFPSSSDTYEILSLDYWWHVGDKVFGARTLTLNSIDQVDMDLQVTDNILSGTGHTDMFLSINGVNVGSWQIVAGDTLIQRTFAFAPITGPIYNIKIEETNNVTSGLGSVRLIPDVSTLTFTSAALSPTISLSTDKTLYVPGETVQVTVDVSNPTTTTYSSGLGLNIFWPTGSGLNVGSIAFTMPPGMNVVRTFPLIIPNSPFVPDGAYNFAGTLIYGGSSVNSTAPFTITRT